MISHGPEPRNVETGERRQSLVQMQRSGLNKLREHAQRSSEILKLSIYEDTLLSDICFASPKVIVCSGICRCMNL